VLAGETQKWVGNMEKYWNLSVAVKHRRLGRMGGTLEINAFFPTKNRRE